MNRGGGWVEKHLLGLFSFSASLCSSPSQNPKITRILARISPHPISLRKEGVGGGGQEGAEQPSKTLNRAKCQQWGG